MSHYGLMFFKCFLYVLKCTPFYCELKKVVAYEVPKIHKVRLPPNSGVRFKYYEYFACESKLVHFKYKARIGAYIFFVLVTFFRIRNTNAKSATIKSL